MDTIKEVVQQKLGRRRDKRATASQHDVGVGRLMPCSCCDCGGAAERQFTEKRATKDLAQYRTKGPGETARLLLAGLIKAGPLEGRLLDIGSGIGALSFELLDRGLTSAVGVDLSSAYTLRH